MAKSDLCWCNAASGCEFRRSQHRSCAHSMSGTKPRGVRQDEVCQHVSDDPVTGSAPEQAIDSGGPNPNDMQSTGAPAGSMGGDASKGEAAKPADDGDKKGGDDKPAAKDGDKKGGDYRGS